MSIDVVKGILTMLNRYLLILQWIVFLCPYQLLAEDRDIHPFEVPYSEDEMKPWQEKVKKMPTYMYPYSDLTEKLADQGKDSITLFCYGSMMNYASANRTLNRETLKTRKPALAFGVKRLFNRDVPIKKGTHWGYPCEIRSRAMLNAVVTENPYDIVNGVTMTVPIQEVEQIKKREVGYNLVPILCINWANGVLPTRPKFYVAYTCSAPTDSNFTNDQILPRPNYYQAAKNAAKDFGVIFYYLWLNTTFFADGKTSIQEWEKSIQDESIETKECQADEIDYQMAIPHT